MQWLLTAARRVTGNSVLHQLVHRQATVLCSMAPHLPAAHWLHTSAPAAPLSAALQQLSLARLRSTPCAAIPRHGGAAPLSTSAVAHARSKKSRPASRARRPNGTSKSKAKAKRVGNNGSNGMANDLIGLTDAGVVSSDDDEAPELAEIMNAVIKVYCVHTEPNYSLPWQRKRQYSSTSSGFIVSGSAGQRWILTNAHSVEYHSQVKVKRRGDDEKFLATVLAIGTECDIALLTVEDDAFWLDVKPIEFGVLPKLQDSVAVVGYPIGGDTISVTSGVVSRIEVTDYSHGNTDLLALQIDAPINSGNSGGPVFNADGQCVGIAFQSYAGSDAENIGYVIPTPVIDHFITDFTRNGGFTGFPALGVHWQRMESAALKAAYGMGPEHKGVLVRKVAPLSNAASLLKPGDIIMSFDNVQIASDGTVPFRTGERIAFSYLTSQKFTGEKAHLTIMRDGEVLQLDVELCLPSALVAPHLRGHDPSYMVVAGFVFTPLTEPYLDSEFGCEYSSDAPVKLLQELYFGEKRESDQELVVLSQVLACDATLGYEELNNIRVKEFNGQAVRNLRHLAELVYHCKEQFLRFDLEYDEVVVLDNKAAQESTTAILQDHSIPSLVSKDLLDVLPESLRNPARAEAAVAAVTA